MTASNVRNTSGVAVGRSLRLRPLATSDYDWLYSVMTHPEVAPVWRFRAASPSPEQFLGALWQGVLAQFIAVTDSPDQRVALVTGYDPDFRSGTVWISIFVRPDLWSVGWTFEALTLLVTYLIEHWDFRKLYAELLAPNFEKIRSGEGSLFTVEGRLRDFERMGGTLVDKYFISVDRGQFDARWRKFPGGRSTEPEDLSSGTGIQASRVSGRKR